MTIEECQVPPASAVGRSVVEAAYFRDAYRTPLLNQQASVIDIFFIVPFHQWGVQWLIFKAVRAGRL